MIVVVLHEPPSLIESDKQVAPPACLIIILPPVVVPCGTSTSVDVPPVTAVIVVVPTVVKLPFEAVVVALALPALPPTRIFPAVAKLPDEAVVVALPPTIKFPVVEAAPVTRSPLPKPPRPANVEVPVT
ncbi:MAG: hypothetical protein HYS15_00620 [Candidatus Spechtbacteria bacterium]|nr:hypothetical protein [Candidatus Spechtbacteria bacterium]